MTATFTINDLTEALKQVNLTLSLALAFINTTRKAL